MQVVHLTRVQVRPVDNHWGWTPCGVARWVKYGWGFFSKWKVEGKSSCLKLGPIVFVTEVP